MDSFYVIGDLYNSLFSVQVSNPDFLVEYKLWNQIKNNLPETYTMPDPIMIQFLDQFKHR
ncbi:hypothetical protein ASD40_13650 [Paenibacillus sp. Root444D2]|nr:hypothetical protein ASD40_13650 [Paenibacillus sp. Root444D2]KRE48658.1 hypothetical protein ASG85_26180 [Paenibacillus sp. Soil724D2]